MEQRELHKDLILRLREGNAKTFELLFLSVYPHLCAFANKFLHDTQDAEEIVQEVFYRLWKNRQHLDEDESIKGYLFTAVKNRCLHFLEHKKVKDKHAALLHYIYYNAPASNGADVVLEASELEMEFTRALEQLPSQCRKIFEMSRFEGLKHREIATHLNISQKTVETQIARALNRIKLQLKDYILILILLQ